MTAQTLIFHGERDTDTLGGRLSRAREAAALTASQFAGQIGVRKETLLAWESDRSEPRANRLFAIAGMLGASPAWLLGGMGQPPGESRQPGSVRQLQVEIQRLKELRNQADMAIAGLERAAVDLTEAASA